jgi:hypothetical protein
MLAWWKARVPLPDPKRKRTPNEVLLELFEQLADQPTAADLRYVLALLLVRRRVFRLFETGRSIESSELMDSHGSAGNHGHLAVVYPARESTYLVPIAVPDDTRIEQIQQHLDSLLDATTNSGQSG